MNQAAKKKIVNKRGISPRSKKTDESLHKIVTTPANRFAVCAQYVKCGKTNCKCASGQFPNSVGGPLEPGNFRKRVLYPVMDDLGIEREARKFGFHILRHSSATILHAETGDIEVAQRALGHSRRSTTEDIYDHAEVVVDEATTGMLLGAIVEDVAILQCSDVVN